MTPSPASWIVGLLVKLLPSEWRQSVLGDLEEESASRAAAGDRQLVIICATSWETLRIVARFLMSRTAEHLGGGRLPSERSVSGSRLLGLARDTRSAGRVLARSPGYSAAAALALALGIGVNVGAFSIIEGVLLRPLPYDGPDRIVEVVAGTLDDPRGRASVSSADYARWQEGLRGIKVLAAYQADSFQAQLGAASDPPTTVAGVCVTPNILTLLGVRPELGPGFSAGDDDLTGSASAIITHQLWQRMGGRPDVVGSSLILGGRPYAVAAVLPANIQFPPTAQILVARDLGGTRLRTLTLQFSFLSVVGRLADGVTLDQAQAELAALGPPTSMLSGGSRSHLTLIPYRDALVGDVRRPLLLAWLAVGLVLLIACANAANLLLARGVSKRREMAVRLALGATRVDLMRQTLAESLAISCVGGVTGLAVAWWAVRAFVHASPSLIPGLEHVRFDSGVVLFTFAVVVATSLAFGGAPAYMLSAVGVRPLLGESNPVLGLGLRATRSHRAGAVLVIAEVAMSVVLLSSAGVLGSAFLRLLRTDLGFRPEGIVLLSVQPSASARGPAAAVAYDELVSRLTALPTVIAASLADHLPFDPSGQQSDVRLEGEPVAASAADRRVRVVHVGADYFKAMGIRLTGGRAFDAGDLERGKVAVVSQQLASRVPDRHLLGRALLVQDKLLRIVGVVPDVHQSGVEREVGPTLYLPAGSGIYATGAATFVTEMHVVVRVAGEARPQARSILAQAERGGGAIRVLRLSTMDEELGASLAEPRFYSLLFGLLATAGLVLAALGIASVLSYAVARATREIGVRMALGATRNDIVQLVAGQALTLTGLGMSLGLLGAFVIVRSLASMFSTVRPFDPLAALFVGVTMGCVVLAASVGPALRAVHLSPMLALRQN